MTDEEKANIEDVAESIKEAKFNENLKRALTDILINRSDVIVKEVIRVSVPVVIERVMRDLNLTD